MGPLIILLSSYFSGSPTLSRVSETEEIPAECQTRPVSTGDVETVCERDNQEEFATIDEEDAEDLKEAKSSGWVFSHVLYLLSWPVTTSKQSKHFKRYLSKQVDLPNAVRLTSVCIIVICMYLNDLAFTLK